MSEENSGTQAPQVAEVQSDNQVQDVVENVENNEQQTQAETPKEETKAEKRLKKLKLKVDGEEFEEEVDLDDDDYLVRQLQLAKMGQKRAQSYSQLEKEVVDFINELKTNPKKALQSSYVGLDIKKLAAEIIEEEIERSQKSPEQLAREEMENELKALKEEREREKEEARMRQLAEKQQQDIERYDLLFEKALNSTDLPKTPYTLKKMADWMYVALDQGVEIEPQEVANLIRDEMQSDLRSMFALMPEEVIEQFMGEENFNRVRKKKIAAAKAKKVKAAPVVSAQKPKQKQEDEKVTFDKLFGKF